MELKDLVKSISDMTDEELLQHISKIRSQRVIRAVPAKRAASVRKQSAKSKDQLSKLVDAMPAELRDALLKKFGGKK